MRMLKNTIEEQASEGLRKPISKKELEDMFKRFTSTPDDEPAEQEENGAKVVFSEKVPND
jgi:YesN/AraC family two-component response regulator